MPENVHHVMWYTVWDAKTGDLIASGTSEMCARRLGYKSAISFASAVSHGLSGRHPARKYIFEKSVSDVMRWTVCLRYATKKEPAHVGARASPKSDESRCPSPQK